MNWGCFVSTLLLKISCTLITQSRLELNCDLYIKKNSLNENGTIILCGSVNLLRFKYLCQYYNCSSLSIFSFFYHTPSYHPFSFFLRPFMIAIIFTIKLFVYQKIRKKIYVNFSYLYFSIIFIYYANFNYFLHTLFTITHS